ncbi:hypothetical protein KCU62_g28, partial [Aureobasidium sp. EXF-3399]
MNQNGDSLPCAPCVWRADLQANANVQFLESESIARLDTLLSIFSVVVCSLLRLRLDFSPHRLIMPAMETAHPESAQASFDVKDRQRFPVHLSEDCMNLLTHEITWHWQGILLRRLFALQDPQSVPHVFSQMLMSGVAINSPVSTPRSHRKHRQALYSLGLSLGIPLLLASIPVINPPTS